MKRIISLIAVTVAFAFVLTSCADAIVKLSKDLDGTWNATSLKVNDEEAIPDFVDSWSITFSDEGEGMGTFVNYSTTTFEFLGQTITSTDTTMGTYEVMSEDDGDKLTITADGETSTGDLTVDGNTMTLEVTVDGETTVIVADKE